MSQTIRQGGGVLVRYLEALNGFRTKYGYWPDQIETDGETLAALVTGHLTPLGFLMMQMRVKFTVGQPAVILAKGRGRDQFDYGQEGWASEGETGHQHDAREWLGISEHEGNP